MRLHAPAFGDHRPHGWRPGYFHRRQDQRHERADDREALRPPAARARKKRARGARSVLTQWPLDGVTSIPPQVRATRRGAAAPKVASGSSVAVALLFSI